MPKYNLKHETQSSLEMPGDETNKTESDQETKQAASEKSLVNCNENIAEDLADWYKHPNQWWRDYQPNTNAASYSTFNSRTWFTGRTRETDEEYTKRLVTVKEWLLTLTNDTLLVTHCQFMKDLLNFLLGTNKFDYKQHHIHFTRLDLVKLEHDARQFVLNFENKLDPV